MSGRSKKPSADGAKKAEKHLESNHAHEFKNGDGTTVPRSTGTLHTLSPKRRRQLESAFGVRPRGGLSWVEAELLHTARAVKLLKPANWAEKWRYIRSVPLVEAVALSLGYETEQPELMKLAEYRERLDLAIRCLGEPHRFPDQSWERLPVDLTEFTAWAKSVSWDIPLEMAELLKGASLENADPVGARNREFACLPRPNRLNTAIGVIVNREPRISEKKVLAELRALDWITFTEDDKIEWVEESGDKKSSAASGFKDRLSRIKNFALL